MPRRRSPSFPLPPRRRPRPRLLRKPAAAPDESAEPAPTAETGSVDQALLSDVLMQTENFSVLLMQNLMNANTEQNSAFSPLALNAVMAALYAGAKGDTEEEMRLLMGYQTEPGDVVQMP